MIEKFYLKALPKMETELSLIKTMIDVVIYERTVAEHPKFSYCTNSRKHNT